MTGDFKKILSISIKEYIRVLPVLVVFTKQQISWVKKNIYINLFNRKKRGETSHARS